MRFQVGDVVAVPVVTFGCVPELYNLAIDGTELSVDILAFPFPFLLLLHNFCGEGVLPVNLRECSVLL
jgi:hypothetical protein